MRRNLGRIMVLWFACAALAWGATYQWKVLKSPQSLRVGQSGVVRYECTFNGSAVEYSTKMKLVDTPFYGTSVLFQNTRVTRGKRMDTIDLLVTPKTAGTIELRMKADIRYTSPGAIENTVLGRDNLSKDDISEEEVALPVVSIHAEENSAALTGNITMEARVDHMSVRAHQPLHLSLFIRGSGNLDKFVPYDLNINGVRIFAEPPQKLISPSSQGYTGEIRQEFALVAEKSYVIAPMSLSVFDTAENQIKILKTAPLHIEVSEGYEPSMLLDSPDLSDTATLKRYALYASLVLLGMVLGEGFRRLWKFRPRRKTKYFWESAKTSKELVQILSLSGEKRYDPIIRLLEAENMSLSEAKKRLEKLFE
ncbi:hypothetical protein [Sulfuricurvum sp.]|uniref:hypothetical protein n=1 Tax=Sulfuricurvum sp. TaxID=2025608 RepID=UPI0035667E91